MRLVCLTIFFMCFMWSSSTVQTRMTDDEAFELFDDAPDKEMASRELPWYLDIIAKPGAQLFVSLCNAWDWSVKKMGYIKTYCLSLMQKMHIKRNKDIAHART